MDSNNFKIDVESITTKFGTAKRFTKEYPNVILHLRIYGEMVKTIQGE